MKRKLYCLCGLLGLLAVCVPPAAADVWSQCPPDTDGLDTDGDGIHDNDHVCLHVTGGDGFANMGDGQLIYILGFADVTGTPDAQVMNTGRLAANWPAPTIHAKQGQKLFISLSNVGMAMRPDLFDAHSVHFHGKFNVPIFDGLPESGITINMGSTLTYFYNLAEEGTFIWHCHVEASEHMQMGMIGNLWVEPMQNGAPYTYEGRTYTKFAYNDGDGSTGFDVEYPIQISGFDPAFHEASLTVQPLPFADMKDTYPMINGRGYPDTINPDPMLNTADELGLERKFAQRVPSLIEADQGQRILLRVSSVSTTSYHTLTVLGLPMRIVGHGARLLRGPGGQNLQYRAQTVTLGGGETRDVILETADVPPGTYFLYVSNYNHLNNNHEEYGGMMTEIRIHPPGNALNPGPRPKGAGAGTVGHSGNSVPR